VVPRLADSKTGRCACVGWRIPAGTVWELVNRKVDAVISNQHIASVEAGQKTIADILTIYLQLSYTNCNVYKY